MTNGKSIRSLRRAIGFSLAVLGSLLVPCFVLLATGQPLPFVTARSATPVRAPTAADVQEIVAPIALYPDALLAQILSASTDPQQLLEAGNWLVQNQALDSEARAHAGAEQGFSAPVRSLLQFPGVLDLMCSHMDWTRQLGEAVRASPSTVLDLVQRLRRHAVALGNLRSTLQQRVSLEPDRDGAIVSVGPASRYVYAPIYDAQVVFSTSSLERRLVPGTRAGVQAVMRFVVFAEGVSIAEAFGREYGDGYGSADFDAYFSRPLPESARATSVHYDAAHAAQAYRRPAHYQHAYDARRLGAMNTRYFQRFEGNANLMRDASTSPLPPPATAMR